MKTDEGMKMLHIAICDDDRQVLDSLHEKLIKAAGDMVGAVEKYDSGEKLLFSFAGSRTKTDVVILDIMLGNDNGIELAKRLREIRPETQVIFLSGHEDYFIQVYDVEHIYFLKKPVKEEDLRKAVELAKKNAERKHKEIFHRDTKNALYTIEMDKVFYLEKDKRKVNLFGAEEKEFSFYATFDEIKPQLNEFFIQCHNSYMVNLVNVESMKSDCFILKNEKRIPISSSRKREAKSRFLEYIERSVFR